MGCAKPAEIPALHAAGKTFTDRHAGHVNLLALNEVARRQLSTNVNEIVLSDAELNKLLLRLYVRPREVAALGPVDPLGLFGTSPKLEGGLAIFLIRALTNDLTAVNMHYRHRNVLAVLPVNAGHAHLFCNKTRAHLLTSELDLNINTGRQVELHQRIYCLRCRIHDIQHTLVCAHLELLAGFLIHVR